MQHAVCCVTLEPFDQTVRQVFGLNRGHEAGAVGKPQWRSWKYLSPPIAPTGNRAFRHPQRLNHLGERRTQLGPSDGRQHDQQPQTDAPTTRTAISKSLREILYWPSRFLTKSAKNAITIADRTHFGDCRRWQ